jgi:hypothetical protein
MTCFEAQLTGTRARRWIQSTAYSFYSAVRSTNGQLNKTKGFRDIQSNFNINYGNNRKETSYE